MMIRNLRKLRFRIFLYKNIKKLDIIPGISLMLGEQRGAGDNSADKEGKICHGQSKKPNS